MTTMEQILEDLEAEGAYYLLRLDRIGHTIFIRHEDRSFLSLSFSEEGRLTDSDNKVKTEEIPGV